MNANIGGFLDWTCSNGDGVRMAVFISGCSKNCYGCHNLKLQDRNFGDEYTIKSLIDKLIENGFEHTDGLTLTGGDPLESIDFSIELCKEIKKSFNKSIWVYTGYKIEEILANKNLVKILDYIDVLVDGKYDESLPKIKFAGSSNQRVIRREDFKKFI